MGTVAQFTWAVTVWRCAVQRPVHPSDDTVQLPEPEVPESLPEALPWTPARCRARLTDPLDPTWPVTLTAAALVGPEVVMPPSRLC